MMKEIFKFRINLKYPFCHNTCEKSENKTYLKFVVAKIFRRCYKQKCELFEYKHTKLLLTIGWKGNRKEKRVKHVITWQSSFTSDLKKK